MTCAYSFCFSVSGLTLTTCAYCTRPASFTDWLSSAASPAARLACALVVAGSAVVKLGWLLRLFWKAATATPPTSNEARAIARVLFFMVAPATGGPALVLCRRDCNITRLNGGQSRANHPAWLAPD